MSPWHLEKKKKVIQPCQAPKNFLKFFPPYKKNYYYSLSEQNVGSCFTGKTKVNTIWSSLSSLTLASQKGISFRGTPSSVTPPSLSHSPLPDNFSICLCFTLLLPCWVFLLCLFFFEALFLGAQADLPRRPYFSSTPDVLPHLPSSGIIGAQKHACCFTCFDCSLPLT